MNICINVVFHYHWTLQVQFIFNKIFYYMHGRLVKAFQPIIFHLMSFTTFDTFRFFSEFGTCWHIVSYCMAQLKITWATKSLMLVKISIINCFRNIYKGFIKGECMVWWITLCITHMIYARYTWFELLWQKNTCLDLLIEHYI